MAHLLVHNHDTSIKTFAKLLNDELKRIPNLNGSEELNLCNVSGGRDIVSVTRNNLVQDMDNLIKLLNSEDHKPEEFLPQVLVAQSNVIQPSQFGRTAKKFQMNDIIKLVNKNDETETITLAGRMFTYETPIQIVILTRTQYASKELSLHLLNILANNGKIDYQLRLHDTEHENELYSVDDYGHIKLVGVKSATFSESTVQESGMVAVGVEFTLRENFFMLKDNSYIMTKYRTEVTAKDRT